MTIRCTRRGLSSGADPGRRWAPVAACILLLLSSCRNEEQKPTDLVTFPLRGEVIAVDTARMILTVSHEEIPGYMMAMTMPFKVRNPALLRGVAVGDSIAGTLAVSRVESWIETLVVIGKQRVPKTLTADDILLSQLYRTGEAVPDEPLLNQDGKPIRFSDFRGKALAVTFIYTRCPLPDFCIRMTNFFSAIQSQLNKEATMSGRWHLLTVSFDPKYDRPAVLKSYAEMHHADRTTWDFATDPDTAGSSVRRIAEGFGLSYADDQGLIAHTLRTALISKEGVLMRVISGNEWRPGDVSQALKDLALR